MSARLEDLNPAQQDALERVCERFNCPGDYTIETEPFDLPEGFVFVTIGEQKGRPYNLGIAPDGVISS
jgi:hypothetical protein